MISYKELLIWILVGVSFLAILIWMVESTPEPSVSHLEQATPSPTVLEQATASPTVLEQATASPLQSERAEEPTQFILIGLLTICALLGVFWLGKLFLLDRVKKKL